MNVILLTLLVHGTIAQNNDRWSFAHSAGRNAKLGVNANGHIDEGLITNE